MKTLIESHPEMKNLWSHKNSLSPEQYCSSSKDIVFWKCENGIHEDYERRILTATLYKYKCPKCGHKRGGDKLKEDISGMRFGRLIAIKRDMSKRSHWFCQCDCGSPLKSIYLNHLKTGAIISCGCYHLEQISGENSVHWKGGECLDIPRASKEYNEWRKQVYQKDWFTCQCCGRSNNIEKNAHHIINFSNNKELRYDVTNGITLCKQCHYPTEPGSFHNLYGTVNNNGEQLENYINTKRKEIGVTEIFKLSDYLSGHVLKPVSCLEVLKWREQIELV